MCAIFTYLMISYIMVVTTYIVFGDIYNYKCLHFVYSLQITLCVQHVHLDLYRNVSYCSIVRLEIMCDG